MKLLLYLATGLFASTFSIGWNADLVAAANALEAPTIYDPSYVQIEYPGGDVDPSRGVCTDVIIRAYRGIGVDLQQLVHEDMRAHFSAYPAQRYYGQKAPDSNIDHRRVPNLVTFFKRQKASLQVSTQLSDYQPGDVVYWKVGSLDHVGILVDRKGPSGNWLVMHNIGAGQHAEDVLFAWEVKGHYRYLNASKK